MGKTDKHFWHLKKKDERCYHGDGTRKKREFCKVVSQRHKVLPSERTQIVSGCQKVVVMPKTAVHRHGANALARHNMKACEMETFDARKSMVQEYFDNGQHILVSRDTEYRVSEDPNLIFSLRVNPGRGIIGASSYFVLEHGLVCVRQDGSKALTHIQAPLGPPIRDCMRDKCVGCKKSLPCKNAAGARRARFNSAIREWHRRRQIFATQSTIAATGFLNRAFIDPLGNYRTLARVSKYYALCFHQTGRLPVLGTELYLNHRHRVPIIISKTEYWGTGIPRFEEIAWRPTVHRAAFIFACVDQKRVLPLDIVRRIIQIEKNPLGDTRWFVHKDTVNEETETEEVISI